MNKIRLTAADIGKRVRLRDGSVTTLIGFYPDARYPFRTSSFQSYTASGNFNAGGGETCMDIVQVLGRKRKRKAKVMKNGEHDRLQTGGHMKIELVIELTIEPVINPYRGEQTDPSEVEWFENHLLADELILHSNLIGSEVGAVRVIKRSATKHGRQGAVARRLKGLVIR